MAVIYTVSATHYKVISVQDNLYERVMFNKLYCHVKMAFFPLNK